VCLYFFGDYSDKAIDYAVNLGYALQLTNIMRDVKVDAERNYIYIPQNIMQKYAYTEKELMSDTYSPAFKNIMGDLASEAQKCYDKAELSLSECDSKKPFLASQIMRAVYYRLLQKIIRKDYQVFADKVRLNKFEKLLAVGKALF
jgi:phytoene synthase